MIAAACGMAAMFTACGDDSSTSAPSSKACLYTYTDGVKHCGSSGLFLYGCGEPGTGYTSQVVEGCPAGGLECKNSSGEIINVYGEETCPAVLF